MTGLTLWSGLVLGSYFAILAGLAVYGAHRFFLLSLWRKVGHRRPATPPPPAVWPKVTIQLPLYNEKYVVERLLRSVAGMDYPREKLEIQVLDDSTDDTVAVVEEIVARLQAEGVPIVHLHRTHREGYKAGALAEGMRQSGGEFLAVFDADFVPPREFLRRTVPHFQDPQVGMVQCRWTFFNRNYSLLTRVQAMLLDAHFVIEHTVRQATGRYFNFNGTAGIWRRATIEDAGGWQADTLAEDTDLSYRAQIRGWRFAYLADLECPSELPVEMNGFKAQQARWAKGLIQVARKTLPTVWKAPVPLRNKIEATFHLTAHMNFVLLGLLVWLMVPAMVLRYQHGWDQMLWIDLPLFLCTTISVACFYLAAQRELFPQRWRWEWVRVVALMGVSVGLALRNGRAVVEALFGHQSAFVRTPKYRIETVRQPWHRMVYHGSRAGWLPWAELSLGAYFLWAAGFAVLGNDFLSLPFLGLFVWGFVYTGWLSLAQSQLEEWRLTRKAFPLP